jgi:hypothetical protein
VFVLGVIEFAVIALLPEWAQVVLFVICWRLLRIISTTRKTEPESFTTKKQSNKVGTSLLRSFVVQKSDGGQP